MAKVEIQLPRMLAAVVDELRFTVEADSLRGVLDAIARDHTNLAVHVFDETGGFRPHVLCFHNDVNTRWLDTLERPVSEGDTVLFMQAVSGG